MTVITIDSSRATAKLIATASNYIQRHIDATARQRDYDNGWSCVSFRDDPNPRFAAEASAFFAWRSAVWTYALTEFAKIEGGQRAQPSMDAFVAEITTNVPMTWPA